jgi:hypothetical protein
MTDITDIDPGKEYTTTEAAEVFEKTDRTIRRWIDEGFFGNNWRLRGPFKKSGYSIKGQAIIDLYDSFKPGSEN